MFTYHLRTGALKRLTYTLAVENSPSFSPDGKSVPIRRTGRAGPTCICSTWLTPRSRYD
ncbi:PD40 domain-containing protein [bacterium]|nr:PD40 domain-containing protein [bacterium]